MTPQQEQNPIQAVGAETVREQDKIQIILSYLGCLSLIPLLTVKDSPFVKWHARQGLTLLGANIALALIGWIPVVGQFVFCLGTIAILVMAIMGIVKGLGGQRWRIPLVGDIAEKINI